MWPCSRLSLSGRETAVRGACHGPTLGGLPSRHRLGRRGPDSTVVTDLPTVTHPVPGGARTGTRFCLAGPNPGLLSAPSLAGPWLYFRPSPHVVSVRDGSVPIRAAAETRGQQEQQAPVGGHRLQVWRCRAGATGGAVAISWELGTRPQGGPRPTLKSLSVNSHVNRASGVGSGEGCHRHRGKAVL